MDEFADIAENVLNKYFGTPKDTARRQYFDTSGLPFCDQIELLHPGAKQNAEAVNEYETTKKITYFSKKPFNDVPVTLKKLKGKGIKTVVSSNNFQELVDELVRMAGLEFDMVLGWKKGFSKGKDHFKHVEEAYSCKKAEMVFIGDSLKDAERAKDFGIDFIGRTGTFSEDDFKKHCPNSRVIGSLRELI